MEYKPRVRDANNRTYDSTSDMLHAMGLFVEIDQPVCITFADQPTKYDVLPLKRFGSGVLCALLHDVPKYDLKQGEKIMLDDTDFILIQTCDPIEVSDYDWKQHLPEKQ